MSPISIYGYKLWDFLHLEIFSPSQCQRQIYALVDNQINTAPSPFGPFCSLQWCDTNSENNFEVLLYKIFMTKFVSWIITCFTIS